MSGANQTTIQTLDAAISAHGRWKHRLRDLIQSGKSDIDPATATRDDACELGKWLKGYFPNAEEQAIYDRVKARHAEFHLAVGQVIQLAAAKKRSEAEKSMGLSSPYSNASTALTLEIMNWKKLVS